MITVADLIEKLNTLPPETTCYVSTWSGTALMDSSNNSILAYEKDGEQRLYFDGGGASHTDIDPFRKGLFGPVELSVKQR